MGSITNFERNSCSFGFSCMVQVSRTSSYVVGLVLSQQPNVDIDVAGQVRVILLSHVLQTPNLNRVLNSKSDLVPYPLLVSTIF